jgi:N-acetylmuramoyl-L-alanine amidase
LNIKVLTCDLGHGLANDGNPKRFDPGAVAFGMTEAEVVMKLKEMGEKVMAGYEVRVVWTRPNRQTPMPLLQRSPLAIRQGSSAFISLHMNAGPATATGTETFTAYSKDLPLAQIVHQAALEAFGLRDRGIKDEHLSPRGNLLVLHNVKQLKKGFQLTPYAMPGCLLEVGFISNKSDLEAILDGPRQADFWHRLARGLGLKPKQGSTTATAITEADEGVRTLYDVTSVEIAGNPAKEVEHGVMVAQQGKKLFIRPATKEENQAAR